MGEMMTVEANLTKIDALARASQSGDLEAFGQLVRELSPVLIRFFRRRGSPCFEDLTQSTWLRVVENLSRYDPSRSFTTWLFTIAYRLWVDEVRSSAGKPVVPQIHDLPERADRGGCGEALEALTTGLRDCIGRLAAEERTIIRLRYWDDLALEEIATRLGRAYGSVKGKAYRAAEKLRKCLQRKGIRAI